MRRAAAWLATVLLLAACSRPRQRELTVQWLALPAALDALHDARLMSKAIVVNVCDPLVRVDDPYEDTAMKSISTGSSSERTRSLMNTNAPFNTPTHSGRRPA